jgi:hypothetical protein
MAEIDTFAVDKLINYYTEAANDIGWRLYNRKTPMSISELDELAKLIVQALEKEYDNGYDEGISQGLGE